MSKARNVADLGTHDTLDTNDSGISVSGDIELTGSVDGRDVAADGAKLDGIEVGATGDMTAAEILTEIKTVDGASSGLDADLLDGQEGSYYTSYTDTAIANLVDSAPATLDTLNELAAALGDDANFSTTVTNSIATKLDATATFGGDVSGTYDAIVIADDSHNHVISNVDGLQTALDAKMDKTANLADITSSSTARSNLGLGTAAISSADSFVAVSGDNMTGNLSFGDNNKAQFGASDDLQIYHTGTESFIEDKGTGNLNLSSNGAGTVITGIGGKTAEFFTGGAVNLYYNGGTYTDPKLSTNATGIDVTGTVDADRIISSGTSGATSLKGHSGTTTTISGTTVETNTSFVGSNSVGNLSIWVDTTTSDLYLGSAYTGGDVNLVRRQSPNNYKALNIDGATGDIAFYEDQGITQKLIWDASAETLTFKDNVNANFGSNNDLQIDHTGTDSRIVNTAGHLILRNTTADKDIYLQADDGAGSYATYLLADGSTGGLKLYHNSSGTYKLVTTSTGIDVVGDIDMDEAGSASYLRQDGDIVVGRDDANNFIRLGSANASDYLRLHSGASERMRIDSSGNVGIGTSSPEYALTLVTDGDNRIACRGTTNTDVVRIETQASDYSTSFSGTSIRQYGLNTSGSTGGVSNNNLGLLLFQNCSNALIGTNGLTSLIFSTYNTERMRIDSSGNLFVGQSSTAAPGAGNTTAGSSILSSGRSYFSYNNDYVGNFNRNTSDGDVVRFRKDGETVGSIGTTASGLTVGTDDTGLFFYASQDAIRPANVSTNQGRDAAITLGASTARFKDLYLSGSVQEGVYNLTGTVISMSNGGIQYKTLTGNTTFTESLSDGQSVLLMIDDGSAYTVTWPTMTWVNNGGSAPTLATSGYTTVMLWQANSTLYGALVGDGS